MNAVKNIAVIGGGPAGLTAAKALALEPAGFSVHLFERRPQIGGLWYLHGDKSKVRPKVPSTDPNGTELLSDEGGFENRFCSSMYQNLETNLIDKLMEFSGLPFEPRTMDFIDRTALLKYIEGYAQTIPKSVNFHMSTNVTSLVKNGQQWLLTSEDVQTLAKQTETFDAVVVANGHSELPFIPDVPGLAEWDEKIPGSITHLKYFMDASDYAGKTILVVGNFASGSDVANQASTKAKMVYVSTKDEELVDTGVDFVKQVHQIARYDYESRSAITIEGTVIGGIDQVVFCTGYLYTFPFLPQEHLTDGTIVKDLYKQIFNVDDPTLAFIGLPKFISPLPLCESQSALVARVFSGRIELPDEPERRAAYEKEYHAKGDGKSFHSLKDCDHTYCNEIFEWIVQSGSDKDGLLPLFWDSQRIEERQTVAQKKKLRNEGQAKRAHALRLQNVSFHY